MGRIPSARLLVPYTQTFFHEQLHHSLFEIKTQLFAGMRLF